MRLCVLRVRGEFKNYSSICAHVPMEEKSERQKDRLYETKGDPGYCNHDDSGFGNKKAEMGFFKRLKFWRRLGNSKTGVVRGILKCFVPCIRRRSRSRSPDSSSSKQKKTQEKCKETTHGRIGDQYEALIQAQAT